MIKAAIIETDYVYANYLKLLLIQWSGMKTEMEVSVFLDDCTFFNKENSEILKYDIVFIDVGIKNFDGIAVAGKLRNLGYKNTIVLIANLDSKAIDGYKVNAYRYYLKPIQLCDVEECMDYVLNKSARDYFQYTYHGVTSRISFQDIICFESMQHYIDIYTTEKTIRIKGALKDIQKQCPSFFVRCQRSYIVNIYYIKNRKGSRLTLSNHRIIDISPKYMETISGILKRGNNPFDR